MLTPQCRVWLEKGGCSVFGDGRVKWFGDQRKHITWY